MESFAIMLVNVMKRVTYTKSIPILNPGAGLARGKHGELLVQPELKD